MCLAVLALHMHPRWPLVIAANRDEFHDRATAPMGWWADTQPRILAGIDLAAGGTWMGVAEQGRMALLTNVRDPQRQRSDAPSRGALVSHWLQSTAMQGDEHEAARHYPSRGCNPFNLLLADRGGQRWWWIHESSAVPQPLPAGVHGVSNARLDTPWPKVQGLKTRAAQALSNATDVDGLHDALFTALADRGAAPDGQLPHTGVPLPVERFLSPAFITGAGLDRPYGTRSSTVLIVQRELDCHTLHVQERTFDQEGRHVLSVCQSVADWPYKEKGPERSPGAF